jgi:hypothetical protein
MSKPDFYIKENSWLAHIAAKKLKASAVAMVLGKTIHLYGTNKAAFLADPCWVKHELCHIKQFKENGFVLFLIKYVWETLKVGYHNNKYEVEAREAECE